MHLSRRVYFFIVFLLALGVIAVSVYESRPNGVTAEHSPPKMLESLAIAPSPGTSPSATPSTAAPLVFPTAESLHQEASKSPEQTPASLIRFSQRLSIEVDEALPNIEKSEHLFDRLEANCVADHSVATTAQTLCLSAAEDLSKKYPDQLRFKYEHLLTASPAEAHALLERLRKLGQ